VFDMPVPLRNFQVTIYDMHRKRDYDLEAQTAWLAIEKAANKFRTEFGDHAILVRILCIEYVFGIASEEKKPVSNSKSYIDQEGGVHQDLGEMCGQS
jgi:hypothetical protein